MTLSGRPALLATLCLLLLPLPGVAQIEAPRPIEELSPDTPGKKPARRPPPPPVEEPSEEAEPVAQPPPPPTPRPAKRAAPAPRVEPTPPPAPPARDRSPPPPLLLPTVGTADIEAAFKAWQEAERARDGKASLAARIRLLTLRDELGIQDLESVSVALIRGAQRRAAAKDGGGAVDLAETAVQLSPDVPAAHWGLLRVHLSDDPSQLPRAVADVRGALKAAAADPRWTRGVLADVGTALLVAWLATALATLLVLFLRTAPSLVHDVHHAFPRGVARWQAGALVVLVLALPWVFRLGLMFPLLVLFAAMTLYLEPGERWLCVAVLAGVSLIAPLTGALVQATTFAGTPAENVLQLERGGLEAAPAAAAVKARLETKKATFPEVYALSRDELRRGKLADARAHLEAALQLRPNDARTLTLVGNVAFAENRWPDAVAAYTKASEVDPTLPDPLWNVAKLYRRRAKTLSDDAVGAELDRAQNATAAAERLDERLLSRTDPLDAQATVNRVLLSPGLSRSEPLVTDAAERRSRVTAQVIQSLIGDLSPGVGVALPLMVIGGLALLGFLRGGRGVSHACDKCGRAVCRRCDPEVTEGSALCHQCVNVYTRRGKVAPMARVNKEMEVRQHQGWMNRLAYGLGLLWSGAGHLFSGLPVRGAVYAFLFAFAITAAVNREGLLRIPGSALGPGGWLVLAVVLLLVVWASSLRHLVKERR